MKKTKLALLQSVIALVLCCSMLIGTTFAWFTDEVNSGVNRIMAGNLDVELEYRDENGVWHSVDGSTEIFDKDARWEPGYTEVVYLRVSNKGSLALKYQLGMNIVSEIGSVNVDGADFKLSDYIHFGTVELQDETTYGTREQAKAAVSEDKLISEGYSKPGSIAKDGAAQYVALVVWMPEETGNAANYMTGENPPKIELGINLFATQQMSESDSFGANYDDGAAFPKQEINFSVGQSVASKVSEDNALTETVTIGDTDGDIYAMVPDGVQMAEGADTLKLSVSTKEESEATIELNDGEVALPLDVHMDGVAEDNTVPMLVTLKGLLKAGLNTTSVAMYHVEDGVTVAMTLVANPTSHNEFSYDPATGDVVLCVASFSEYVSVTDNYNLWKGEVDTSWYTDANVSVFTLSSADQLAGFGKLVDEGNNFDGKTVKLGNDIDLSGGYSLNPIGCGYADSSINSNSVKGCVFSGTFDGGIYDEEGNWTGNYTISGLYQNGWELGLEYCNLGGGLFASVKDATIKNLTISGAEIIMECVEMGVVAGLVQGSCTFDNINIYGCKIANYQRATGGLIGEVSGSGETTISNVDIDSTTVVGSLWGDFDCPVGGVIGARWDNENKDPKIIMENVNVACRLDVYNDVTSAYQWYAYRRAGMLIGNTEKSGTDDSGRTVATADFLTCKNVVVYYGDWVDYHYCEFTNQESTWCNNYPWVRVEAGENCSAYSNPRYGHPILEDGNTIDGTHEQSVHKDGDGHEVEIMFSQLYGGGQGVYGAENHYNANEDDDEADVTFGAYTITYINDSKVLDTVFVTQEMIDNNPDGYPTGNTDAQKLVEQWLADNDYDDVAVSGWMNAGSTKLAKIPADNTENVVLYPYFDTLYTATFVDQEGKVLDWDLFTKDSYSNITDLGKNTIPPKITDCEFDYWLVIVNKDGATTTTALTSYKFADGVDVTIYPIYTYDGDVNLIPVDNDGDGITDEYQVGGYSNPDGENLVEIPGSVNGIEVTEINSDAFASYDDLTAVKIPASVKIIGGAVFADDDKNWTGIAVDRQTVTLYYEGTPAQWAQYMTEVYTNNNYEHLASNWDENMGEGSRVFFLDENDKVVESAGYWELTKHEYYEYSILGSTKKGFIETGTYRWVFHNHSYVETSTGYYVSESTVECEDSNGKPNYHYAIEYTNYNHEDRVDKDYWPATTAAAE